MYIIDNGGTYSLQNPALLLNSSWNYRSYLSYLLVICVLGILTNLSLFFSQSVLRVTHAIKILDFVTLLLKIQKVQEL